MFSTHFVVSRSYTQFLLTPFCSPLVGRNLVLMGMSQVELQRRVEQNANDTVEIYDLLKTMNGTLSEHTRLLDGLAEQVGELKAQQGELKAQSGEILGILKHR